MLSGILWELRLRAGGRRGAGRARRPDRRRAQRISLCRVRLHRLSLRPTERGPLPARLLQPVHRLPLCRSGAARRDVHKLSPDGSASPPPPRPLTLSLAGWACSALTRVFDALWTRAYASCPPPSPPSVV